MGVEPFVISICQKCRQPFFIRRSRASQPHCSNRCAARRGAANNRYNGGLCFHAGRWIICCRDGTMVHMARAVMEAELKRPLHSNEIVHHVNGDTANDRPENLRITTRAEHIAIHRADLVAGRGPESIPRGEDHWMRKHPERVRRGENHARARITQEQADEMRVLHYEDWSERAIARQYGVSRTVVRGVVTGRSYVA